MLLLFSAGVEVPQSEQSPVLLRAPFKWGDTAPGLPAWSRKQ